MTMMVMALVMIRSLSTEGHLKLMLAFFFGITLIVTCCIQTRGITFSIILKGRTRLQYSAVQTGVVDLSRDHQLPDMDTLAERDLSTLYTFVETDPQANFRGGIRHREGAQYER